MRALGLFTAVSLAIATPAFATEAEWVSHYSNPEHSNSLNISTNPQRYHQVWQVPFQPYDNTDQWWSLGFVIADGKLINGIATYNRNEKRFKNHLFALDTQTGLTLWSTEINHDFWYPSYQNNKIFLQGNVKEKNIIAAYHPETGQMMYSLDLPANISTIIPYANKSYYSMDHHSLGQYDLATGDIAWQRSLMPGMFFSSWSLNHQDIITREFDAVRILDNQTGIEHYKFWVPDSFFVNTSYDAPAVNDDYAFALFQDDDTVKAALYAFDIHSRSVKWALPDQTYSSYHANNLVLINKTILVLQQI